MRVAAILACAITVVLGNDSVVDLYDNGCPRNPAIKKQLPHDNYCNMFYMCSNGAREELHCSGNLLYNEYTDQCDYPWNVDCGDKSISESKPPQEDIAVTESNEDDDSSTCNSDPSEAPEICAQPENDGVLVAHESCNFFYKCSHGKAFALRCPRNTGYNACRERCDWLENIDCGNRTMPDDSDVSDENVEEPEEVAEPDDNYYADAAAICAKEESDGVLVPHDNCNWFYICSDGQPIAQVCSPGTMFNPRKGECDWQQNVNCGNKTTLENVNNDDGSDNDVPEEAAEPDDNYYADAAAVCAQEESDGVLVPHDNCNWFYICSDGQPMAQVCSPGTMFNPRKGKCDWPQNVNCGNKTELQPEPQDNDGSSTTEESEMTGPIRDDPAQAPEICAQDGSDGVLVAHEDCNKFVTCVHRRPTTQRCSVGLLYDPRKERCEWSQNVDCGNRTIPDPDTDIDTTTVSVDDKEDESIGPVNANPAEAPIVCAQEESDGVLIANEDCNKYYICDANVPVTMKCGKGLNFNTNTGRCDWPENVDCGNRTVPVDNDTDSNDNEQSVNDDPAKAPEICAQDGSNGVLIAHENCNQYYKCYAGVPNALRCSNNLLYDVQKGWCDWAANVDCGDRIKPETSNNNNPSDASAICAQAQSDGVLVAHENCNQYFKCSHGVPVALECMQGLLYNVDMGVCDWPMNVDCGERQQ